MAWTKSPQGLIDLFEEALPDDPRVERRKMFGYPCIFVSGNMCAGLHQSAMFARLSPGDAATLPEAPPFEPMPGRPMAGYTLVPDEVMADEPALAALFAKAVAFTATLPPKQKTPKAAGRAKAARA
jgi:TfoX/Sxy family transcriptional regulator of competence genes